MKFTNSFKFNSNSNTSKWHYKNFPDVGSSYFALYQFLVFSGSFIKVAGSWKHDMIKTTTTIMILLLILSCIDLHSSCNFSRSLFSASCKKKTKKKLIIEIKRSLTPILVCQSPDEGRRINRKFEVCEKLCWDHEIMSSKTRFAAYHS